MSKEDEQLSHLAARIKAAKGEREKPATNEVSNSQLAMVWRISIELVAGVMVGSVIGYYADKLLGTSPLFLMAGVLLGTLAGFKNMQRIIRNNTENDV